MKHAQLKQYLEIMLPEGGNLTWPHVSALLETMKDTKHIHSWAVLTGNPREDDLHDVSVMADIYYPDRSGITQRVVIAYYMVNFARGLLEGNMRGDIDMIEAENGVPE